MEQKDDKVWSVPLCDGKELVRMLTDGDLLARSGFGGSVIYCFEDQEVEGAMEILSHYPHTQLAVLNPEKEVLNVLGYDDLLARAGDGVTIGHILGCCAEPSSAF